MRWANSVNFIQGDAVKKWWSKELNFAIDGQVDAALFPVSELKETVLLVIKKIKIKNNNKINPGKPVLTRRVERCKDGLEKIDTLKGNFLNTWEISSCGVKFNCTKHGCRVG